MNVNQYSSFQMRQHTPEVNNLYRNKSKLKLCHKVLSCSIFINPFTFLLYVHKVTSTNQQTIVKSNAGIKTSRVKLFM